MKVLVPFYRGAVVFRIEMLEKVEEVKVLVPFYRGAVVFKKMTNTKKFTDEFSSPFIEERLYLIVTGIL